MPDAEATRLLAPADFTHTPARMPPIPTAHRGLPTLTNFSGEMLALVYLWVGNGRSFAPAGILDSLLGDPIRPLRRSAAGKQRGAIQNGGHEILNKREVYVPVYR